MPPVPGSSHAAISGNIAEMERAGYPPRQAIAAALSNTRRHPRAGGGLLPHFDDGGTVAGNPSAMPPAYIGANPQVQQLYQRFASLPLNQLQQLAVMMPASSLQGQMVRRAMQAKQMAPASTGAVPSLPTSAPSMGLSAPSAGTPTARRGGLVPRRQSGGLIATSGGNVASTPEGGFGAGSTEPLLQREAMLQGQGLSPQQVTQTMMGWSPSSAQRSAAGSPQGTVSGGWSGYAAPFSGGVSPFGGGAGFPSASAYPGGTYGGSAYPGGTYGSNGAANSKLPNAAPLPMMSFSPGNPGEVGPSWSPGQPLLSASSASSTTPPGFGSAPAAPLVTQLPASVLNANAPAPAPAASAYSGTWTSPGGGAGIPYNPQTGAISPQWLASNSTPLAPGATIQDYMDWTGIGGFGAQPNPGARRGGRQPQRRAYGGLNVAPTPEAMGMYDMRRSMEGLYHPGGFINSPVAGRTDHLPLAVAADSHVIPADVVSGLGEGNSLNGAALLDRMFHSGPWGMRAIPSRVPSTMPRPPGAAPSYAAGGAPEKTTEILAAGGEYIVRPEAVAEMGRRAKRQNPCLRKSDMEAGHDAIDRFIVNARKHIVATTKKLPGPVKG